MCSRASLQYVQIMLLRLEIYKTVFTTVFADVSARAYVWKVDFRVSVMKGAHLLMLASLTVFDLVISALCKPLPREGFIYSSDSFVDSTV